MNDDRIPHPLKNFVPRGSPPRVAPVVVDIDPHDDSAVREMNRKELVLMVQTSSTPAAVRLACIKELNDRIDGRSPVSNAVVAKPERELEESDEEIINRFMRGM